MVPVPARKSLKPMKYLQTANYKLGCKSFLEIVYCDYVFYHGIDGKA